MKTIDAEALEKLAIEIDDEWDSDYNAHDASARIRALVAAAPESPTSEVERVLSVAVELERWLNARMSGSAEMRESFNNEAARIVALRDGGLREAAREVLRNNRGRHAHAGSVKCAQWTPDGWDNTKKCTCYWGRLREAVYPRQPEGDKKT